MKFTQNLSSQQVAAYISLVIGAALALLVLFAARSIELREIQHEFSFIADARAQEVEESIQSSLEILYSVQSHFNASNHVTRDEFRIFTSNMLSRHIEIQAIEWIPRILNHKRNKFESRVSKETFTRVVISQRTDQGNIILDTTRTEYFPVDYLEPLVGNETALGFNLASNDTRFTALKLARDSGEVVATSRITLVQEKQTQSGTLIFYPIYKNNPGNRAERRKNLVGFVLGVFRIEELVKNAFNRIATDAAGVVSSLTDITDANEEESLFSQYKHSYEFKPELIKTSIFSVAGRSWEFTSAGADNFISSRRGFTPFVLFFSLLLATIVLFIYFHSQHRSEKKLRQSEKRLGRFFDASMEGLFFHSEGKILDVNKSAAKMLNYKPSEIIGKYLFDFTDPAYHELAMQKMNSHSTDIWEAECITKEGRSIPVEVQGEDTLMENDTVRIVAIRDISQRKNAERELKKYHAFTEKILGTIGSLVIVLDREGRIVRFNAACEQLTGYAAEEVMGRFVWDFLLPSGDIENVIAAFNDLKAGNFPNQYQNAWLTKSGVGKKIDWLNSAIVDEQESVEFIIATGLDVTDRLRIERELDKERTRQIKLASELTLLIDNANAPIFGVDKRGRINEWNRKMVTITGYNKDEVLGCNLVDEFISKEYKKPVNQILKSALDGVNTDNYELPLYAKSKKHVLMLLNAATRRDTDGNIIGVIGVGQDITELDEARSDMEQKIRERTRELNTIFTLSPDGFVLINENEKVVYANPAFLEMSGYKLEEVIAKTEREFSDQMYALQDTEKHPEPCQIRDGERTLILNLIRPSIRVVKCTLRTILDDTNNVTGSVLYFRDITHESEVDQMKSDFLSTAAHELRTPLASILGFSELLLTRKFDAKKSKDIIETIHRQSNNLKLLLDELLDLARIEARAGKDFDIKLNSLEEIVKNVFKEMASIDPSRVVHKNFPEKWPKIYFDKDKITQVVRNIMSNAFKYSPAGSDIEIKTATRTHKGNAQFGLVIIDHGIGMNEKEMKRLGERFYRADDSGVISGTGLGITLVMEIMEVHKGEVEFTSKKGEGTSVTAWFPIEKTDLTGGTK